MTSREPLWTIDELGAQVALALAEGYAGQANGQVRDVPDRRSIRYYTTLGLIDRPAVMRGRTALYGQKHLLQLVAIKRLQTRGLTLAEIQRELVGLPISALRKLAKVAASSVKASPETPAAEDSSAEERRPRGNFWTEMPAATAPSRAETVTSRLSEETGAPAGEGGAGPDPSLEQQQALVPPLQGVVLDNEVTLLVGACRLLEEQDLQAIRTVAAPLLKLLEKRRLIRPRAERENHE
jgi:hypothetical protein